MTEGYQIKEYQQPVKRYCQTMDLKDDPQLIAEYRRRHSEPWFVVVANEVTLVTTPLASLVFSTIAGVLPAPVEVHIINIFQEHVLIAIGITGTIDARTPTVVIHQQVVMEGGR